MSLTPKQLASTLVEHLDGASEKEVSDVIKDFVQFLHDERLLGNWREIEQQIHRVWKEKYGASKVRIISAHALTEEAKTTFETLTKGADVEENVDARLIGGAVIRVDDKRIDGSISGMLRRLKTTLAN